MKQTKLRASGWQAFFCFSIESSVESKTETHHQKCGVVFRRWRSVKKALASQTRQPTWLSPKTRKCAAPFLQFWKKSNNSPCDLMPCEAVKSYVMIFRKKNLFFLPNIHILVISTTDQNSRSAMHQATWKRVSTTQAFAKDKVKRRGALQTAQNAVDPRPCRFWTYALFLKKTSFPQKVDIIGCKKSWMKIIDHFQNQNHLARACRSLAPLTRNSAFSVKKGFRRLKINRSFTFFSHTQRGERHDPSRGGGQVRARWDPTFAFFWLSKTGGEGGFLWAASWKTVFVFGGVCDSCMTRVSVQRSQKIDVQSVIRL